MQAPPRIDAPPAAPQRRRRGRVLRFFGWTLMIAGAVVLLYVVHVLFYSGVETQREQRSLLETWEADVGPVEIPDADATLVPDVDGGAGPAPDVGDAVAIIAFERPGADERPVSDDYLAVVEGVGVAELQSGPGHYPDTAMPGEDGNFAVAGHRVTYAAPFYRLDELRNGDEIHVWDRSGAHYVYRVSEPPIVVRPTDGSVLGSDPLETGESTITLTTCHPRFSARQRMIAFGELVS